MVFLCIPESLNDFRKRNRETNVSEVDWLLFDNSIKNKSLKCTGNNMFNLECYMSRIVWYPIWYKEPLYCYLMTDKYFNSLNLFGGRFENSGAIWNMKRVPNEEIESDYPRVLRDERIFGGDDFDEVDEYIYKKFQELVDFNLKDEQINYVVLGEGDFVQKGL